MNVLLVEPDYKSKFPPLGLLRIATFHKERGDAVTFTRGKVKDYKNTTWNRIYVSSLFTYELPRTVETIRYYLSTVARSSDIFVGGIGATLMPQYIRDRVPCTVIEGPLDRPGILGLESTPIADYVPDYGLLASVKWQYYPSDSYFCRLTTGCIRRCKFCAVPRLEPEFGYCTGLDEQIRRVKEKFGERQHLVLLDNNILAADRLEDIIRSIRDQGFEAGAVRNSRRRTVDFNQGIDARLITKGNAQLLATICLSPVRLAFDSDSVEQSYRRAVRLMADVGFKEFTTYVMFNFEDSPESFWHRLKVNVELSMDLGIRVTGFPMRFVPITDVDRHYVSPGWRWKQLRGIQCILLATHGMVSPNPDFFGAAFGNSYEEFEEIISMPDRYIIYRNRFKDNGADDWRKLFRRLNPSDKEELYSILATLNKSKARAKVIATHRRYAPLLEHYYPRDAAVGVQPQLPGLDLQAQRETAVTR